MKATKIDFMVHYVDPIHTVEGAEKTRHFTSLDAADRFVESLLRTRGSEVHSIKIIKQTTTIERVTVR